MYEVDKHLRNHLKSQIEQIETEFQADAIFFFGEIHPSYEKLFRDFIEELKSKSVGTNGRIAILLNTPGGSAETAEKMADIIRFHYGEVYFIVPDYAMSAGTILCMSGDKIYMDYSSSLGPIDPQILIGDTYVPALGYLDKVEEMLKKSAKGELTDAEFVVLQNMDLARLKSYEQAKELTISLLKEWLVKYKFKSWTVHRSAGPKNGHPVTVPEKEARAAQIATDLGDNKMWHTHGRSIDIKKLKILRLEIDDYSTNLPLRALIRSYNDVITDYIAKTNSPLFIHNKHSQT